MLFRKKIQRSCSYCSFGAKMADGQVLCSKRGFRSESDSCRKFRYDPTKRIPLRPRSVDFSQYDDSNFTLND